MQKEGAIGMNSLNKANPFQRKFDNLEQFADFLSEIIHCPVTIEDANHRLLAYSSHDNKTDAARVATIIGRRVPEKVINRLWKDGVIPALNKQDEPVIIPEIDDIGLGDRVAVAIRKGSEVLGYIWIVEAAHKGDQVDRNLLTLASEKAKKLLLHVSRQKVKREKDYQELFWELLTGNIHSHDEAVDRLSSITPSVPPCFSVMAFQIQGKLDDSIHKKITYLINTQQQVKVLLHTLDDRLLLLLASTSEESNSLSSINNFALLFLKQLKERFRIENVRAACSSIQEGDLTKTAFAYQEALSALSIKQQFPEETNDIVFYHDLGVFRYLNGLLEQRRDENHTHPGLRKLREYDSKNNTELYDTLETYLNRDGNINEAAKDLHVHVNTLNYRVKRICEIAQIDVKNPHYKLSLYLEIKLERLDPKHNL
ncbi:PucR family transcriptional regulator [Thalassorhabdus alkalitolerans]